MIAESGVGASLGRSKAHNLPRRHWFGKTPSVGQRGDEIQDFKKVLPISDGYLLEIFCDLLSHNFGCFEKET